MLTAGKNIPRPQLSFKDKIDNSSNLWRPKIKIKPHSMKPLSIQIVRNDNGIAYGYEHPYDTELTNFQPLDKWLTPDVEKIIIPLPLEQTRLVFVSTEEQVDDLVQCLQKVEELAIDLEHHSYRSYQGFTCLIQISTIETDYIIDAISVRDCLFKLNDVFTDPKILKIFHGAEMDIQWLQRDFGLYVVGMFDTYQAARIMNFRGKSLAALLLRYCFLRTDKSYQLADWRLRPLTEEMVRYARTDTHYLLYIWHRIRTEVLAAGGVSLLKQVFLNSREVCRITYKKQEVTEDSCMSLYHRNNKTFNPQQMAALRMLYKWRDDHAREMDESTMYLIPNHMLIALAEKLPCDMQGINSICNPMPPFVRQNMTTIHRMILSCRQLPMIEHNVYGPGVAYYEPRPEYNVHDVEMNDDIMGESIHRGASTSAAACPPLVFDTIQVSGGSILTSPDIELFLSDYKSVKMTNRGRRLPNFVAPPHSRFWSNSFLADQHEFNEFQQWQARLAALDQEHQVILAELERHWAMYYNRWTYRM